jgi:hypothetical protein
VKRAASRRAALFVTLFLGLTLAASAVDFQYDGPDCRIVYRFLPRTGTLSDLLVIYNDSFTFYPAYHGGITSLELGGSRFKPWEGTLTSEVIGESSDGSVYQVDFRWSSGGETFRFKVGISLRGKTLVMDYAAQDSKGAAVEFGAERSENTPAPKVVVLPYGHNVLWTAGVFISAVLDPTVSAASSIRPLNALFSGTSAYYSDLATYAPLTSGRRNGLKESLSITISPKIEETFVLFSNPVSAYRESLSNTVVRDVWLPDFTETRTKLDSLASLGMSDLLVIQHVWQKYGYDNGLPTTYPAGEAFGGPAGLAGISETCRDNGYLLALHTNYVDFYPNSDVWNSADVALSSAGTWVKSWFNPSTGIQSFLLKPTRALDYARLYEPSIHDAYGTTAAYLDVHSAILPSFKVDFDARLAGAGEQKTTFESYRDLFDYVRSAHGGPLTGEGFGYAASTWAGYIDALEADPRSYFDVEAEREGSEVPTLVDYRLRMLHGLFVPHGAGYLERFYHRPFPLTPEKIERYRATELAFGNAGFLTDGLAQDAPPVEQLREYCFLKHLQAYYLTAQPVEISYFLDGETVDLSAALNKILPSVDNAGLNSALREDLSRVRIVYDSGFLMFVNRSASASWAFSQGGSSLILPPGGFLGILPGRFIAYTAVVQGSKGYFVWPAESCCRGHLDDYLFPPIGLEALRAGDDLLPQARGILLTWQANPSNQGVVRYRVYAGRGTRRSFLGEVDAGTFAYFHRGTVPEELRAFSVTAVNAEGREGEAASVGLR